MPFVKSADSPGRKDRFIEEQLRSRIRNGIEDGKSNNEIARSLGCSDKTVARHRKRLGLPNFYGK